MKVLARQRKKIKEKYNTNLLVQFEVGERQFDSLANFLFLYVKASNHAVSDIRPFASSHQLYAGIGFRWKNVNQSVGMSVQGN